MTDAERLVLKGFEQLNRGNIEGFYALLAEDVCYRTPAGTFVGRDAALDADMALFTHLSRHWRVVERIVVSESKVAVWLRFGAITKDSATLFELELCNIFTVEGAHIRQLEIYGDFTAMFEALSHASNDGARCELTA